MLVCQPGRHRRQPRVSEDEAVFAGHPGPPTAAGVPVALTAWFGGPAPAAVVTLDVSEGDSASCGTTAPPAGMHYLFVSYATATVGTG